MGLSSHNIKISALTHGLPPGLKQVHALLLVLWYLKIIKHAVPSTLIEAFYSKAKNSSYGASYSIESVRSE